jgi:hypothetical protein
VVVFGLGDVVGDTERVEVVSAGGPAVGDGIAVVPLEAEAPVAAGFAADGAV